MLYLLFACMALIRMVPAQNRSPEKYAMQPLDYQTSYRYQPPSNGELFYSDPRKYDRSAEPTKEQPNHPPESPEIPSNLTVPSSTQLPHTAKTVDGQEPGEDHFKDSRLQQMVQQLYMAQGQVQLEAAEIQRAQTVAAAAQQNLEDAANNVRVITAALRAAQETVATAALRAQTAQLQLAAHDQLLFTARQRVDALSGQMVGLQAEVSITADSKSTVDLPGLLNRLKEPLRPEQLPTPIPDVVPDGKHATADGYHQYKPHSIDNSVIQPLQSKDQFKIAPKKRSIGNDNNMRDQQITSDDLRDLLNWVHNARDQALSRDHFSSKFISNPVPESNNGKYVTDFVSNMQNLNFNQKSTENRDQIDRGLVRTNEDDFEMASYQPKSNDEIINDSIRAVEDRNRRSEDW